MNKQPTSKQKGNTGEEQVARLFTKWTNVKYKRRTGSGATDNHDYRTRGDIAPLFPSKHTLFSIEVKTRTTKGILDIPFSDMQEGMNQSINDAGTYRIPVVVIVDKHKNPYLMISWVWLSRLGEINPEILNTVLKRSIHYSQAILPLEKLMLLNYMALQSKRGEWCLEHIEDLATELEFAIGLDQPYHYDLMSIPQYVEYYNKSFPKRKQIDRSHVNHALNSNLIHGFTIQKNDVQRKLVALTERTLAHVFRYKAPK